MSTNRYIDKLKVRLAKEADQRMQLQALLDDQVSRNRALLAKRDALAKAAQRVLDGLNARIDEAVMLGGPLPVFEGIADLHDALQGEQP